MPDDRDQSDHWDFLAADLGATPAPEEEAKEEESEVEQVEPGLQDSVEETDTNAEPLCETPAEDEASMTTVEEAAEEPEEKPTRRQRGQRGDRVVSGFGYRRGSVDWANLARELGVDAIEEVPSPIPAADIPGESESSPVSHFQAAEAPDIQAAEAQDTAIVEAEVVEEEAEPTEVPPPAIEPEPVFEGFGAGILDDLVPDPAEIPDETAEAEEAQEERKGRRRRRRRKPRKQESDQEQPTESQILDEAKARDEVVTEEGEEQEEKPRRRGRKRGGRKRTPREEVTSESDDFGMGLVDDVEKQSLSDEFEVFELEEVIEDAEDGEASRKKKPRHERTKGQTQEKRTSKKVTHRGIPSWDEAVGHIIDVNMEGRAKKPDAGGSRQRSGRRRGGDRSSNRGRS